MIIKRKMKQNPEQKNDKLKILAAGDFHGDSNVVKKLAKKAKKEKVDLIILIGDIVGFVETENIIKPFITAKQKVLFVPGNWESTSVANTLSKKYGMKNIEDHYVKYGNVGIFGIGSSDWALYLDEKNSFKKLSHDFEHIKNLEKKILVSHIHAAGTKSELSGIPGSKGLKKAIVKFQPDLFIAGHIHELEGVEEKIGKTKVVNVGRKGKIFEI